MDAADDFGIPIELSQERGHLKALFEALAPEARRELAGIASVKTIKAGTVVVEDGEDPVQIGYIVDGNLAMTKVLPDGRTHIIGLLVPTDMYGRVFDGASSYRVEALTETRVFCFDRGPFEAILRKVPEIERLFLVNVLDELDAAREWILLLGGHKAVQRLASFLLILSRRKIRLPDGGGGRAERPILLHVAIRRVELAHYLGTRPETLSRAFHQLARSKAIRIVDAFTFEVLDLASLIEFAGHDLITNATQKA